MRDLLGGSLDICLQIMTSRCFSLMKVSAQGGISDLVRDGLVKNSQSGTHFAFVSRKTCFEALHKRPQCSQFVIHPVDLSTPRIEILNEQKPSNFVTNTV